MLAAFPTAAIGAPRPARVSQASGFLFFAFIRMSVTFGLTIFMSVSLSLFYTMLLFMTLLVCFGPEQGGGEAKQAGE